MPISGEVLIGGASVRGTAGEFRARNPATGEPLEPIFGGAEPELAGRACELAAAAFDTFRETSLQVRATFLEAIADRIAGTGADLIERAGAETGLTAARLAAERDRTVGQLRLFAEVVRDGSWIDARVDIANPDCKPPRADLRMRHIPLGPVVVFAASNFPLAFSVAGGDTAAALAAGCPVIVKAHSAHPGTSELVGRAIQGAVADCGLPEGVFSLLFGVGTAIGATLVADRRIKAVGFTGSRAGGTALMAIAARRPEPIAVYAEMSSINPVFLLPGALSTRASALGEGFVASLTLGAGQFCTNPGLVIAIEGHGLEEFLNVAGGKVAGIPGSTMLTAEIHQAFVKAVGDREALEDVTTIARGRSGGGSNQPAPALFATKGRGFLADTTLQEEVFGAASLVVECSDFDELCAVAEHLEGQLTATLHMDEPDKALARRLLPILERKVGRILVNDFPTGVQVSHAMVHGGPFPATSDGRSTSVGTLAIRRFLRPVCYQNVPPDLLPDALDDRNSLSLWRRVNGDLGRW